MLNYPVFIEFMVKERHRELLQVAKNEKMIRAIREIQPKRPGFRERISIRFAEFLISLGSKIKERHQPPMYPCTETFGAGNKKICV